MFMSGAAPLPQQIFEAIKKDIMMPVSEGYGLTEASPVTHANPLGGRRKAFLTLAGRPLAERAAERVATVVAAAAARLAAREATVRRTTDWAGAGPVTGGPTGDRTGPEVASPRRSGGSATQRAADPTGRAPVGSATVPDSLG